MAQTLPPMRACCVPELDEVLELTARSGGLLDDWRTGKNTQHSLVALLRQSIFSRLAGYEDTNDAERLALIPPCDRSWAAEPRSARRASTSQMGRFETEVLTQPRNLAELTRLSGLWIAQLRGGTGPKKKPPHFGAGEKKNLFFFFSNPPFGGTLE